MTKEVKDNSKEIKKITKLAYITLVITIFSGVLSLVNSCSILKDHKEEKTDTSMMHEVGIADILDMFNSNKTYVIYIGRDNCDACIEALPVFRQAQTELNFITQYLDILTINRGSSIWKELIPKLDVKVTSPADSSVVDTFGNLLDTKGITPCIIMIKNGKQVAGFFGGKSLGEYKTWLKENGL